MFHLESGGKSTMVELAGRVTLEQQRPVKLSLRRFS
jgi:hypothetical protein